MQADIVLEKVYQSFQEENGILDVLRDINLKIYPQQFLCVLGPSGCGKSTLLRLLAELLEPSRGKIMYASDEEPNVGLVFQQANLMPWRTVMENITLPLEIAEVPKERREAMAMEWIETVGLQEFISTWPSTLSGGMAQRVALARALIQNPDLLLLDEPFGSLDALTRERLGSELLKIWEAQHKTVVMVTHSISEALLLSDRVVVMTPRPATIVLDLINDLPRPRSEETQYDPHFLELARELRNSIQSIT